jgi:hypothetical protein
VKTMSIKGWLWALAQLTPHRNDSKHPQRAVELEPLDRPGDRRLP